MKCNDGVDVYEQDPGGTLKVRAWDHRVPHSLHILQVDRGGGSHRRVDEPDHV